MGSEQDQRPKGRSVKRSARTPASALTRPKRLSLHPLTPEQALRAFMQVDPKKVKEREERERAGRRKRPRGGE